MSSRNLNLVGKTDIKLLITLNDVWKYYGNGRCLESLALEPRDKEQGPLRAFSLRILRMFQCSFSGSVLWKCLLGKTTALQQDPLGQPELELLERNSKENPRRGKF